MSDFCLECSRLLHFETELAGLVTKEEVESGLYALVLCEECGPVMVDDEGRCCSEDCVGATDPHGHRQPRLRKVLDRIEADEKLRRGRWGWYWRSRDWLLGSRSEPGQVHYLKWRWYDFRDRIRGRDPMSGGFDGFL